MHIAYLTLSGKGTTDRLIAQAANEISKAGLRAVGAVQVNIAGDANARYEMRLKILPDGPEQLISQDLGPEASGCVLDPAALEEAVGLATAQMERGADLLIINKFGKIEAEGRGFRALIGEALSRDIPVLIGLNPSQTANFRAFAADFAQEIEPTRESLWAWLKTATKATAPTR